MLVIFLPLFALCMPSLLGDWERARRNETSLASRRFMGFITPPGASYRRQSVRTTCRSRACIVAASSISLDPTANPCDDLFGHVCNNWIRDHRLSRNAETWEVNRDRRTVDHLHQAALTEDLHKILAARADGRWLPVALHRLYSKCLKPGLKDAAELRTKLLDSASLLSWPYSARDKAHAKDISKAVGNAYYFTNEPALLRMGVGADGRAFLAEPRLLLDALTVGPREVAQAAAAVFLSAGGQLPVPEYVNKVEELLDKARRGDDPAPWNTTLRLPAKYEPELALYALTALSPLVTGVDTESLLGFLRRQLSSEIRAGALDLDDPTLADHLADRIYSMPWIGPAPSWLRNVTLREAYFMRCHRLHWTYSGAHIRRQPCYRWHASACVRSRQCWSICSAGSNGSTPTPRDRTYSTTAPRGTRPRASWTLLSSPGRCPWRYVLTWRGQEPRSSCCRHCCIWNPNSSSTSSTRSTSARSMGRTWSRLSLPGASRATTGPEPAVLPGSTG
ncbi:uncharacterized protein LOC119392881 isoform X2 [Rhipicephalus sanguineus]|uniref:uncharacterized protein LOC119392881 isoform X2 n=1 Tax=Rhipicephalus sanguineus TaxID=34632 RepID=UPI0020C58CCD|nr:uncharacterized protein LOC119392881 isoform X2 [Rhipicephalus sanguineus]